MAELMNDNIITNAIRQIKQAIAEIEIASPGTAPPTRLLIADANSIIFKTVKAVKIFQPFANQRPRFLSPCQIIKATAARE